MSTFLAVMVSTLLFLILSLFAFTYGCYTVLLTRRTFTIKWLFIYFVIILGFIEHNKRGRKSHQITVWFNDSMSQATFVQLYCHLFPGTVECLGYMSAGIEIFADAAVLVKKPRKLVDSPDSATTFLYKSAFCNGCQHSEKFTYLLCETKGSDDRDNIEKTMESLHLKGQLIYYNNNIFYWRKLDQYMSFGNRWIGDSKFVEGVQGVGNSLSNRFNPNSNMTSIEINSGPCFPKHLFSYLC